MVFSSYHQFWILHYAQGNTLHLMKEGELFQGFDSLPDLALDSSQQGIQRSFVFPINQQALQHPLVIPFQCVDKCPPKIYLEEYPNSSFFHYSLLENTAGN